MMQLSSSRIRRIRLFCTFLEEMPMKRTQIPGRLPAGHGVLLLVLPLVVLAACLCLGRMAVPVSALWQSLGAKLSLCDAPEGVYEQVLWSMRLPRLLLAIVSGAGLAVAGCAFQSLFANPLATPDTLGVASGASFGAALALLLGLGIIGVQLTAMAFGVVAVALTWLAGSGKNSRRTTMILAGIMIGSLFSALISLVKYVADPESQLPTITYWLMGSYTSAGYKTLALGAPLIVAGVVLLWLLRWRLNLLPLSDDEARTSGVNIRALRTVVILCATAITASCVSMCGQVGWVGLLVPHICRMKYGSSHLSLLPACISTGAVFMMLVDTAARTMTASEIPLSVLTAILGAPFFIILMRRSGGWSL